MLRASLWIQRRRRCFCWPLETGMAWRFIPLQGGSPLKSFARQPYLSNIRPVSLAALAAPQPARTNTVNTISTIHSERELAGICPARRQPAGQRSSIIAVVVAIVTRGFHRRGHLRLDTYKILRPDALALSRFQSPHREAPRLRHRRPCAKNPGSPGVSQHALRHGPVDPREFRGIMNIARACNAFSSKNLHGSRHCTGIASSADRYDYTIGYIICAPTTGPPVETWTCWCAS